MARTPIIVPGERYGMYVPGSRESIPVAGGRTALSVARAASAVEVPGKRVAMRIGNVEIAPQVPHLDYCLMAALSGIPRVTVSASIWTHVGQIAYRVVRIADSVVMSTSAFYPATPAYQYVSPIQLASLTIGEVYRLEYYIDCTPDVGGYVESWTATGIEWTQPSALQVPIYLPTEPL
jgi:hypothetical protein